MPWIFLIYRYYIYTVCAYIYIYVICTYIIYIYIYLSNRLCNMYVCVYIYMSCVYIYICSCTTFCPDMSRSKARMAADCKPCSPTTAPPRKGESRSWLKILGLVLPILRYSPHSKHTLNYIYIYISTRIQPYDFWPQLQKKGALSANDLGEKQGTISIPGPIKIVFRSNVNPDQ